MRKFCSVNVARNLPMLMRKSLHGGRCTVVHSRKLLFYLRLGNLFNTSLNPRVPRNPKRSAFVISVAFIEIE